MQLDLPATTQNVVMVTGLLKRIFGLLGRSNLPLGEVWVFPDCRQIHTVGMRFSIDVAFLDKEGKLLIVNSNVGPGKIINGPPSAYYTIECRAGSYN